MPDGKWLSRRDSEPCPFRRARALLLDRLDYFDRKTLARIALLKINVLSSFGELNCVSGLQVNLRARRQLLAFTEITGDRKLWRRKFGAPVFHNERFPLRVLQTGSEGQPMMRAGDDAGDGERAFRLAFPKERAVEFRFASKRRKLIAGIDKIGSHHGYWKGDGDLTRFCNFTTRRIDHDAAGIGLGI